MLALMHSLKLIFVIAFAAGYLAGRRVRLRHGSPLANPALGRRVNLGIFAFFAAAVGFAAFVRLAFDIELLLPPFVRMHATHFKWWGIELLFSGVFGFTAGIYSLEERKIRMKTVVAFAVLFAAMLAGEYHYTRPIYFMCRDTVKDGVIFQSFQSTCGPASVANLLARSGHRVSEREVAKAARTRYTGTTGDELSMAIGGLGLGLHAHYFKVPIERVELIGLPCVLSFGEEHFVTYIGKKKHLYEYIDPSIGTCLGRREALLKEWDGKSLFVHMEDFAFEAVPGDEDPRIAPVKKALAAVITAAGKKPGFVVDAKFDRDFATSVSDFAREKLGETRAGLDPYINLLIFAEAGKLEKGI